jgi:hypothetical protein
MPLRAAVLCALGAALLVEFWFLARVAVPNRYTVSATLEQSGTYRGLMTVCELSLLALCVAYFRRHRHGHGRVTGIGVISSVAAMVTWCGLVAVPYTADLPAHALATGGFLGATLAYGVALGCLDYGVVKPDSGGGICEQAWYPVAVATGVLGVTYTTLWATGNPATWAVEHACLVALYVSHVLYFAYHPFTPVPPMASPECLFVGIKM